ncbi:39S ribosomal protein L9, mitochondrial [Larimichthys crocea]|uniref:Uncharacterized protein n=1 Tax=Larimichthys crocea TaxID=215358 RepID=A0ACD3RG64_LARCR|nr:39S ribosomal protein L9, mitochondrial [Larimichthys crocea]
MNPSPDVERSPQKAVLISTAVVLNIIWWMVMIAAIGVGTVHLGHCPLQPYIPIYLIVLGVSSICSLTLTYAKSIWDDGFACILSHGCMAILHLFSFCWFIAGNFWVYSIYPPNYTPEGPRYCQKTAYQFAFIVTTVVWASLVLACCCGCSFSAMTCCTTIVARHCWRRCSVNMWSSGRVLQELLRQPVRSFSLTRAQNTVVVERWWQVPLSKVGSPPRLHPRRHRIYKLVEDTKNAPKEKMELILTQTVPKLGGRGDTVFVKKSVGRNKLLPEGLAVYPSPENKQIFAEELRLLREGKVEERVQTRTGQLTVEFLKRSKLRINKMPSDEFQVTKEVVRRQLLKKLQLVVPPHALSLPFESVKDLGDYWCEITVNGIETVRVPMSVLPYEDRSARRREQADISEPADAEEAVVKAVSDAAVEAEAGKDCDASASAGASAAESTQTNEETTAPPSDSHKKG